MLCLFNLDPSLKLYDEIDLYPAALAEAGSFTLADDQHGRKAAFKADDQGKFDVVYFSFSQRAGSEFTGKCIYAIYDVTSSASTLTAADFDYLSSAMPGGWCEYLAAAEISGRITGQCDSTGTG